MCTAMTYQTEHFYFGRTLDYDTTYGETVTVMPRRFPLSFRHGETLTEHYAMIGMAHVADGYPLYYDAINEKGLGMAGLNFVGNAQYASVSDDATCVAQYEFIAWVLSRCASLDAAKAALRTIRLVGTPFDYRYPTASLHWLIADKSGSVTVECTAQGFYVYDNPAGVLTNNPPFPEQMHHLDSFSHLTAHDPHPETADLHTFSRGRGGIGLPGDLTSQSRFVRAAFARRFGISEVGEQDSVGQFFRMMETVSQTRGCCLLENGKYEITLYTSCCDADAGIYYYTTYDNHRITAVDMHHEPLDSTRLVSYPLVTTQDIKYQN